MPATSTGMTARRRFYLRGTRRRRRSVPSVMRSMKRLPTFVATRSGIRTSWNDDRPQFARLTASCVTGPSASFAFEIAVDLINNCGRNLAPFSRRCRCRRPDGMHRGLEVAWQASVKLGYGPFLSSLCDCSLQPRLVRSSHGGKEYDSFGMPRDRKYVDRRYWQAQCPQPDSRPELLDRAHSGLAWQIL